MKNSLIFVTTTDKIPATGYPFEVKEHKIALYKVNDKVYALEDRCTHMRIQMTKGFRNGEVIGCPVHGALFDIATGKVLQAPAYRDIPTFAVVEKNGDVYFDTDQISAPPEMKI